MKKMVSLVLALSMLLCCATAFAEGRERPADKKVLTTTDVADCETVYKVFDNKFYEADSEQPGTIVRLDYKTSAYGAEQDGWVNVYLPYGYDENGTEKYNIIYFFHGTNETQNSLLVEDPRVKNALDNMIEVGVVEPFIMVCPTYYYNYEERAIDMPNFMKELRYDILPLVESTYRTYAETCDDAGFAASREHRAFSGYSRGSYACWHTFCNLLDLAKWYMPFSAAISGAEEMTLEATPEEQLAMLIDGIEKQSDYKDDFYLYIACGGARDMMYDLVNAQVKAMIACPDYFRYGTNPETDNFFYCLGTKEIHQTLVSRNYFYNAFDVVFR